MKKINIKLENSGLSNLINLVKQENYPSQKNLNKNIDTIINLIDFYDEAKRNHNLDILLFNGTLVNYNKSKENILFEHEMIYYKKTEDKEILTLKVNDSFLVYLKQKEKNYRIKYLDNLDIFNFSNNFIISIINGNNEAVSIVKKDQSNNFNLLNGNQQEEILNYKSLKNELFSNINSFIMNEDKIYELKVKNHIIEKIRIKNNTLYDFTIKKFIEKYLIENNINLNYESLNNEKDFEIIKNKLNEINDFNHIINDTDKIKIKNKNELKEIIFSAIEIIKKQKEQIISFPEEIKKFVNDLRLYIETEKEDNKKEIIYSIIEKKELKEININDIDFLYNNLSKLFKRQKTKATLSKSIKI